MVYLGIIGQSVAAILLIIGVTLQVQSGAELSHVLVAAGGLVFGLFTKIRLVGYEWDELIAHNRKKGKR